MLGPNHSMSGFGTGLAVGAIPTTFGHDLPLVSRLVLATVVAGAALVPDWDHPSATVSKAFGPLSWMIAKVLDQLSQNVYQSTKTTADRTRKGGHRTLTHTVLFAVVVGVLIGLCSTFFGSYFVIGTLYVSMVLALRGLAGDWAQKTGWIVTHGLAVTVSIVIAQTGGTALELGWWTGLAVTVGMITHSLGDAVTNSGAPLLWPIKLNGRRWYRCGLTENLQLTTGSWVEKLVVGPTLVVLTISVGWITL